MRNGSGNHSSVQLGSFWCCQLRSPSIAVRPGWVIRRKFLANLATADFLMQTASLYGLRERLSPHLILIKK